MKLVVAALATATAALAGSSVAQAATLAADPDLRCYPENSMVFLPGEGFTPNAQVDFSRDGMPLEADPPIVADGAGLLGANLTLPGLLEGQRTLNYLATDTDDPENTAALSLLVTATDVKLEPEKGEPERLLTVRARGFFGGGKWLWAHVVRRGSPRARARSLRIGRIKRPCKKVRAKRRLFKPGVASGVYRVQFDVFRRYRKKRDYTSIFKVTISGTAEPSVATVRTGRAGSR
jgi:hypothetical protein